MNLPARHAAVFIARAGGPEVLDLRRVPLPQLRGGEVLIAVQAAGVNRHDCNQQRHGPTPAHTLPVPAGLDMVLAAALPEAHRLLEVGTHIGKLVLDVALPATPGEPNAIDEP